MLIYEIIFLPLDTRFLFPRLYLWPYYSADCLFNFSGLAIETCVYSPIVVMPKMCHLLA